MTIVPDTKDWTWVLERPCPECGFDTRTVTRGSLPGMLRGTAGRWQEVIAAHGEDVRERARADRWSRLEYACHVRDVFVRFHQRLELMLSTEGPTFPNWDQDATAVEERYNLQDPAVVSAQLGSAAEALAARFARVGPDEWGRRGLRSDGAAFTVETLGRYLMHDPVHHLWDVGPPGPGDAPPSRN